jgi:sigma-B regulation protein RsbU (phosphoserine phosphatase)
MLSRLVVGIALALLVASAQEGVIELNRWKVQAGDNPAWAAPDFDDSAWQTGQWPTLTRLAAPVRIRWYRASIEIEPALVGQDLAIALAPFDEVYEVYVDGKLVGTHGSWSDRDHAPFPSQHVFRVPSRKNLTIAIRRWTGATVFLYRVIAQTGIFAHVHPPVIGLASLMTLEEEKHKIQSQLEWTPNWLGLVLVSACGMLSFVAYLAQRSRRDNLWFGLMLVSISGPILLGLTVSLLGQGLRSEWSTLAVALAACYPVMEALWLRSICPQFGRLFLWAAGLHAVLGISRIPSFYAQIRSFDGWMELGGYPLIRMSLACVAAYGLLQGRKRWHSILLTAAVFVAASAHYWRVAAVSSSGYFRPWGLYLDSRVVAELSLAGLALVGLYLKHLEEQKQKEILDRDLGAARLVQDSLLVAEGSPEWAVDAVYLPANEVGGDFYHTTLGRDGSLLLVTGDVSGKGLPASLLVAAAVGALGDLASHEPAAVLAHLNRALLGKTRGGFVTCACALFQADGQVVLANAGHMSPWVDGQEMELEAGLPLGVVDGVAYDEKRVSGKRFVFVSDGVVEAANAKGELLGFDQTRDLSMQPAMELAKAAKAWGQNDDITVVTVRSNA